jgi:hypothetical protein
VDGHIRKGRVKAIRELIAGLSEAADTLDVEGEPRGKIVALTTIIRFLGAIEPENSKPRLPFKLMQIDLIANAEGFGDKGGRLWDAHALIAAAIEVMTAPASGVDRPNVIALAVEAAAQAATIAGVPVGRAGGIDQQVDEAISKIKTAEAVKNIWKNFQKAKNYSVSTGKRRVPERIYRIFLSRVAQLEKAVAELGQRDRIEVLALDLLHKLRRYRPTPG